MARIPRGTARLYYPHSGVDVLVASVAGEEWFVPAPLGTTLFVSNLGRVVSDTGWEYRPYTHTRTGYVSVHVRGWGREYVHRLVLMAFAGGDPKKFVRHRNGDRADNRLHNLEWAATSGRATIRPRPGPEPDQD